MAKLAALLKTRMGLPQMAEVVRKAGKGGDTILAHINPREAALLKAHGGSGRINPATGLPMFDESGEGDAYQYTQDDYSNTPEYAKVQQPDNTSLSRQDPTAGLEPQLGQNQLNYAPPTQTQPAAPLAGQLPSITQMPSFTPKGGRFSPAESGNIPAQDLAAPAPSTIDKLKSALGTAWDKTSPADLIRLGTGAYGAYQANKNTDQMQKAAADNEAQIKALAAPYQQQGKDLVAMGQQGQLTAPQQQQIQAVRAQMAQSQANSGQSGGGTVGMQNEAIIQRMSQQYAQDNIDQGMKLINIGDKYITDAIKTGYAMNKDAQAVASDFYKYLAYSVPGSTFSNPNVNSDGSPKQVGGR